MNDSRDQRELRASDGDRDRVAEQLREAAAEGRLSLAELDERIDALYAAKTYGALDQVVDDLPGFGQIANVRPANPGPPVTHGQSTASVPARASEPASVPDRVGGVAGARSSKAIFSGVRKQGRWVVPSHYSIKAVFGGGELDLRQAQLETRDVEISVKAVFGGVVIIVPEDVYVMVDGDGVFGGFADEASADQPPPGAPVLRVGGKAVFGGVSVQRKPVESR